MSLMPATPKATRYGDFAPDLGRLNQVQARDQEWRAETTWQDNRLVVAHDPQAELFSYAIDEDKKRYLELLDGKLLLVTNKTVRPELFRASCQGLS